MNSKFLFGLCAASLMFTACQDDLDTSLKEGESMVTFTAQLPSEMAARTYADGKTAKNLTYAVYDANTGAKLIENNEIDFADDLTAEVNLRLVNGKTYDIVFFASADNAPYTFDGDAKTVTVDYTELAANNENCDAFYTVKQFNVSGTLNETVKLYRPFAQLNIGATDAEAAATGGFVATTTQVKTTAYNTLNLMDGTVTGKQEVTYNFAAVPENETFPASVTAEYLAMNYILVNEKELVEVEFTAKADGHSLTRNYSNVPVQRNYRTNIYGNILTEAANFNVEIEPAFNEPAFPMEVGKVVEASNQQELNEVMATLVDGKVNVVKIAEGSYIMPDAKGKTINVIGTGDASKTVISAQAEGEGDYAFDGSTVTFENITITTTGADFQGFVRCNGTFNNCIFNNPYTCQGTSEFINCTFNVTGDKYNVWTWGSNCTFTGCTFNCSGKAMLVYGGSESTIKVNDCTFNGVGSTFAKTAIEIGTSYGEKFNLIVNNTTVNGFNINTSGPNTHTTLWSNKNSMDDAHLSVTIDGLKYKADGTGVIASKEDAFTFAKLVNEKGKSFEGITFVLANDIDLANQVWTPVGQTVATEFKGIFDGKNHTIKNLYVNSEAQTSANYASGLFGWCEQNITIKNVKIDGALVKGHHDVAVIAGYLSGSTKVENCHVTNAEVVGTHANGDACGDKVGTIAGYANSGNSIKDCTASNSTVKASRDAGQIVGAAASTVVTNCSATNVKVSRVANDTCDDDGAGTNINNTVIGRVL